MVIKDYIEGSNRVTPAFLQEAIDLVVRHEKTISFLFPTIEEFRETLKSVDEKGCGFFRDSKDGIKIAIYPPSEVKELLKDGYTVNVDQDTVFG